MPLSGPPGATLQRPQRVPGSNTNLFPPVSFPLLPLPVRLSLRPLSVSFCLSYPSALPGRDRSVAMPPALGGAGAALSPPQGVGWPWDEGHGGLGAPSHPGAQAPLLGLLQAGGRTERQEQGCSRQLGEGIPTPLPAASRLEAALPSDIRGHQSPAGPRGDPGTVARPGTPPLLGQGGRAGVLGL